MANTPAVIGSPSNNEVTEDTSLQFLTAVGAIPISDANPGQAFFKTTVKKATGTLGTLTLAADGTYTYSVANSAVQYLGAGKTKVETFTVTSIDGTTKQISFTIKGTNDAAAIGTPTSSLVTEDTGVSGGNLKSTGTLSISDTDQGEASFKTQVTSVGTNLGTLTIAANGSYTYSVSNSATQYLGANDTKTETFTVTALDGTTKQISFTIQGKNDGAVIGTPTVRNTTDTGGSSLTATGMISVSDVDQGQAAFNTTVAQGTNLGTLSLNANGSYTYSVAKSAVGYLGVGATKTETFTITSVDGTSKQVSFVVTGINDAAVIGTPTVSNVTEDATTQPILYTFGSISITDADQGEASFKTALISGQGALGTLVLLPNGGYTYFVASSAVQYLGAGDTKVDTFTITSKDGTTAQVSFTIHGTNDAAVIGTPTHRDVTADPNQTTLTATGSISISDVDQNQASFKTTVVSAAGNIGNLSLNSNGTYSYTVPESAAEQLGIGGTKVDTFTVTSFDGTSKQVTFVVHGPTSANHPAVIGNPSVSDVTEDATSPDLTATGTISISDADGAGEAAFQTTVGSAAGNLGTLSLSSNGSYTYTVANSLTQSLGAGSTKVDTFTVTSADGTAKQVTFTINGTNDAAVIGTPAVVDVTEDGDLSLSGTLTVTDTDQGQASFQTTVTAVGTALGSLTLGANGAYTYSVPNSATQSLGANATHVDTFTIKSLDNTTQQVSFTIHGVNDVAVIGTPTVVDVTEDANVVGGNLSLSGTLSISDADQGEGSFQTTVSPGAGNLGSLTLAANGDYTYSVANSATQSMGAGVTRTDTFTVQSQDGTPKQLSFTIHGSNDAAVIGTPVLVDVTEDVNVVGGNMSLSGTLSVSDDDQGQGSFQTTVVPGGMNLGTLTLAADGSYTYSVLNSAAQVLGPNVTQVDTFTITSLDGTSQQVSFNIHGAQDAPTLSVATASGTEDNAIPLTITSALIDRGSALTLTITGVPDGVTFNNGAVDANDPSIWHLSDSDLAGLSLIPAPDFSGTVNLSVSATSTHFATSSQLSTAVQTLTVNIAGVADAPTLTGPSTSIDVDASADPIPLGLHVALVDGSESLGAVTISGVTGGYVLSAGVYNEDGDYWLVPADQLAGLTMQPGTANTVGASGPFQLHVTARSIDGASVATTSIDVTVNVAPDPDSFSSRVVDGYISGATVFSDDDGDGEFDVGVEASATTAADGTFTITGAGGGKLVMFGGVDVSTGLDFHGTLSAVAGSTVITPLTTLVAALATSSDPADIAIAQTAVLNAFGLGAVDLQTFDPVAAAAAGGAGAADATKILAAGIQVQTTIAQITAAAGSTTTGADVVSAVASAISDAAGGTVNLSNTTTLTSIIQDAAPTADPAAVSAATLIVSEANAAIATAAAGTGDPLAVLTSLAQAASVALGQTTDALADAAAALAAGTGDFTDAVSNNTGGALTTAIQTVEVGDPDGSEVGTLGNDTISGAGGNDVIDGLDGNDTLSGLGGKDTIHGGNGNDTVLGGDGDDNLYGDDGRDLLSGGAGDDIIDGGNSHDRATYAEATGSITVDLAAGTVSGAGVGSDELTSVEGIIGSNFADTFDATGFTTEANGLPGATIGYNEFEGLGGNDLIIGAINVQGQALTRINYLSATGAVTVDIAAGAADGDASVGHDTISYIAGVWGSAFNDTLRGSDNVQGSFEAYEGRGGDDLIDGRGGYDIVTYNTDTATTSGIVTLLAAGTVTGDATVGTDTLRAVEAVRGTNFNDVFDARNFGSAGALNIGSSGTFNDFGGAGGNDTIFGNGATRLNYALAAASVSVNLETSAPGTTALTVAGSATGATEGTDTFTGVNAAQGSVFNDTFLGSAFNNTFTGLGGDDFIDGRGGFDTASYNSMGLATAGVTVNLAAGTVIGNASIGTDTLRSIEGIQGTHFADTFNAAGYGQAGAANFSSTNGNFNQFEGLGGDDIITGNGNTRLGYFNATAGVTVVFTGSGSGTAVGNPSVGTDTFTLVNAVTGSAHGDSITGDNTNNLFDGGAGDDIINGGGGSDTITGGAGNDTIDGGSGFADMAVYTGARGSYTLNLTGAGAGSISGPDGSDTFNGIEVLQFSNQYLLTASGTSGSQVNVSGLNFVGGLMVTTATGSNDDFLTIGQQLSNRVINLGDGTSDTITLGVTGGYNLNLANVENLKGTGGDDSVSMITNVNGLAIDLGAGINGDSVFLANGANTVSVVNVENLNGSDFAVGSVSNDTLTLSSTVNGVSINLGNGVNTINLAAGNNSLVNVFGTNVINGTASGDTLTVVNGLYQSTVDLGGGTDTLILSNVFSTLGLVGVENVIGAAGDDYLVLQNAVTGATFDLGTGNDTLNLANGVNSVGVVDVEAINGSDFGGLNPSDDTLTLLNNVSDIRINLGDGNNTLNLAAGINSVQGHGLQTINGTTSDDALTTLENAAGSTIDLGAGTDTLNLGVIATGVTVRNVENVNGSAFNDTITIANSSGTTTVTGGMGSDFITASAGQDNIRYTDAAQAGIGGGETVNDFNAANDTFALDHVAGLAGQIHFVGNGAFTGSEGNLHSEARLNGNTLQIDVDGDGQMGAGDMEITLNGLNGTLTDANFVTSGVNHTPTDISLVGSSIAENTTAGTVVGTLSGTDPDAGDILTFSIVNPNGMFAINGNDLVVAGPIDYEAGVSQSVTVRVTDASGATCDKLFNIGVTDANDAPTVISGTTGSVAENAAISTVVYQAIASDQDATAPNNTITWSLTGTDAAAFSIDASGNVTLNDSANYEFKNSYSINVVATDGGTLSSTKAVTISVTDVNEAPTNIGLSGNTIAEGSANGTVVGTLSDVDPDAGDSATYTLTGNAGGRFAVSNGQIVVAGALDFETATSHQITVRVTDGGGNTFDKNFTIGVTDVTGVTLNGDSDDNTLIGTSEADTLNGLGGNDLLKGLAGNDTLDGGLGFDRADYSDATGGITVNLAAGTVTGPGVGSDTLVGIEAVTGSNFADTFNGAGFTGSTGASNTVVGQDDFEGRGGDDTITGTVNALGQMTTRITYISAATGVTVDLAAGIADGDVSVGHDTFTNVNSIIGSNHDDTFYGSDNALFTYETYEGRAGNDFIDGRGGFDQVNYNNNSATTSGIVIELADGIVTGDASVGTDTLRNVEAARGTIFDDIFDATGFGSAGAVNAGYSGAFNDFGGAAGNDTIIGNGSTRLNYQTAASSISVDLETSAPGTNAVTVAGAANSVTEGTDSFTGVNAVQGSMFGDTLLGSSFNNTLIGLGGDDFIDGRGGFDTAGYNSLGTVTSGVTVNMGAGTASGDGSIGVDTLRNIEGVQGTMLADSYDASTYGALGALNVSSSNGAFNQFEGLGGNDSITGNGSTRVLYSNSLAGVTITIGLGGSGSAHGTAGGDTANVGTDTFVSGVNSAIGSNNADVYDASGFNNGYNSFQGNAGNDQITGNGATQAQYGNATSGVTIAIGAGGAGSAAGDISVGTDTFTGGVNSAIGSNSADSYDASAYVGFNAFQGQGGNDTITGNGATEIQFNSATGGVNVNLSTGVVTGNASVGADTITGGVNRVVGTNFNDTLTGGAGNETLIGNGGNDTINGGAGNDVLSGGGGADKFVFATGTGADTVTDFVLGFGKQIDLTGMNGVYSFADVQAHATQVGGNTVLTFGTDSITLQGVMSGNLAASDFIFGSNSAPTDILLSANSIAENSAAGTVVGTLSDVDVDVGDSATYTLTNDANGRFAISNGQIVVVGGLDYETTTSHQVTVRVTDGGGNIFDKSFSIAVTNANEAPTNISVSNAAVPQGSANGTVIGALSAIDPDAGDTAAFSLVDGAGGQFNVTGGNIVVAGPLTAGAQQVIVRVTDALGLTFDKTITINVNAGSTIVGTAGSDPALNGTPGDDLIQGLGGNDRLQGMAGMDTLDGGLGFDRAVYTDATGGVTVNLAAGTVSGAGVGSDTLTGIEGIVGSESADTYDASGFAGNTGIAGTNVGFNEFEGRGGNDTITSSVNSQGALLTRISYANAATGVTVDLDAHSSSGGDGNDILVGSGFAGVVGSGFDDQLLGSANAAGTVEVFEGRAGNDTINGRGGFDRADYAQDPAAQGVGITVNLAIGEVTGDPTLVGTDTLRSVESVRGTNSADTFNAGGFGNGQPTTLNIGNNGTFNEFNGMGGNDTINGNGNTRVTYINATGGVVVDMQTGGTPGTGTATGDLSTGTDTFSGVNAVQASMFNDTLSGSNSTGTTETFFGAAGDDFIDGRGGFDVATYNNIYFSTGPITVNFAAGTVTGDASVGSDTLRSIEALQATNFNDVFVATGYGVAGALNVSNSSGNFNQFEGLGGNDTITGNGNTRLTHGNATAGVTISMLAGTVTGDSSVGSDTFVGVNSANGSNLNDTYNAAGFTGVTSAGSFGSFNIFEGLGGADNITGNGNTRVSYSQASGGGVIVNLATGVVSGAAGADVINGGVNSVQGSNQVDTLTGGSSDETFFGAGGGDTINGGGGNDGITGQGGNDLIDGGAGTDMVFFTGAQGTYAVNPNTPTVGQTQVVDSQGVARDATDTLSNVEVLHFNDAIVLLSSGTVGSPIDISSQNLFASGGVTGTGGDDFLTIGANINGRQVNLAGGTDTVTVSGTMFGSFFSLGLVGVENLKGSNDDNFVNLTNTVTSLIVDLGGGVDNLVLMAGSNSMSIVNVESIGYGDFGGTSSNDALTLLNNVTGVSVNLGNGDNTLQLASGTNSLGDVFNANHINGSSTDDALTIGGFFGSAANSTIDLGLGDDAVTIHSGNTAFGLVGVEHLNGSGQDNALTIQTNATGLAINLGGGNDSVWLANGSNSVSVTDVENVNGSDFTGGITPSNDTLELLNNVSGVTVNLGDGTNTLNLADGNNSFDALHGVNFVNGTSSSDTLTLNGYQGSVDLGGGTDTLNLNGGSFNLTVIDVETINGSALQDNLTISNTSGSTTVTAGAGYDGITAGAGQDNFRFTSVSDSLVGGSADQITNFDASSDTFTFSGIAIGDDHIEYVGTGAFAGSGQASAHLLNNGPGANVLQIDIDGDGTMTSADMEIGLNNLNGTLSNSNFLLI